MKTQYYLAAIKFGDESNSLIEAFIGSFPQGIDRISQRHGFFNDLKYNLTNFRNKDERRFSIFKVKEKNYEKGSIIFPSGSEIIPIYDTKISVAFFTNDAKRLEIAHGVTEPVEKGLRQYDQMVNGGLDMVVELGLKHYPPFKKFKKFKGRIYTMMGIQTANDKYLLESSSIEGPF